jgi:hypothetical protein
MKAGAARRRPLLSLDFLKTVVLAGDLLLS